MRLRATLAAILSALTVAVGTVGLASPSAAAAPPVIVSPGPGGTLVGGSTGPVVIDFPAEPDRYSVNIKCSNSNYSWWGGPSQFSGRQSFTLAALTDGGKTLVGSTCQIDVSGGTPYATTTSTFTVVPPPLPTLVSPSPGGTVDVGSTGPLVIDFPVPSNYRVTVKCGDGSYSWSNNSDLVLGQPLSGRRSFTLDPLVSADKDLSGATCQVDVDGGYPAFGKAAFTFTLAAPPLALGAVSASAPTFYPLVEDGYLDETAFRFNLSRNANLTLTVKDAKGKTVLMDAWNTLVGPGPYERTWNGRTKYGNPTPGRYTATITATAGGVTLSSSAAIRVATKTVTRRTTLSKDGSAGRVVTRGKCTVVGGGKAAVLDCWDGDFAAVTHTFKIPAKAKKIRWGANVSRASSDECCRGTITKRGARVGKRKFQVRTQVTGSRAAKVDRAWVSYKSRVQI